MSMDTSTNDSAIWTDVNLQHPLMVRLRASLERMGLAEAPVILAVSGGRDSMAMMHAMWLMRRQHAGLSIGHVHHGQREESDAEWDLVSSEAHRRGLPIQATHLQLDAGCSAATLREARMDALVDMARAVGACAVLTAHHAEDQAETVLLAMIRGAGPAGLTGMRPLRELEPGIMLARPMLDISRQHTTSFCVEGSVPWADDPGNVDVTRPRSRLRRDVLPVLEAIRSGAVERMAGGAEVRGAAAEALAAAILPANQHAWARDDLKSLPAGLRMASLHAEVSEVLGGTDLISSSTLQSAVDAISDQRRHQRIFEIGGGLSISVEAEQVRIIKP